MSASRTGGHGGCVEPPRWSESLVMDVTTTVLRALAEEGVQLGRDTLRRALGRAGIAPGEIR